MPRTGAHAISKEGIFGDAKIVRDLPLSIFIIARNEADRLPRTLEAIRTLSSDVIVVDSGSTDGTQALAEAAGARVIHRDWEGYGPQKRFAETQCRHPWLLNIDADEWLPANLVSEIRALFGPGEPAADAPGTPLAQPS